MNRGEGLPCRRSPVAPKMGAMNQGGGIEADLRDDVVAQLRDALPTLLAVYAFGSVVQGTADRDSDLDLAVLVEGRAEPMLLFELAGRLADLVGRPVDLLDFGAASTVLQHRILTRGQRWWARGTGLQAGIYECGVLSQKTELDEARAGLLADIETRGTVHGR